MFFYTSSFIQSCVYRSLWRKVICLRFCHVWEKSKPSKLEMIMLQKKWAGQIPFHWFYMEGKGFFLHCLAYGIDKCYILDVLRGQPIKLIQVLSTSEFHEYWWKEIVCFFKILPSPFCKASEEQTWKRPYLIYCLTSEKVKGL